MANEVRKTDEYGTPTNQGISPAKPRPTTRPTTRVPFHASATGIGTVKSMIIGYARVSTHDQNIQLQTDALTKAGCEKIYADQGISGTKTSRPQLDRMIDTLRAGDTVTVWKLDRLGRSVQDLVALINLLRDRHVQFVSLTEAIDTTTTGGILIFNIFASLAQFERDLIVERTTAGLQAAKARGHKGGRPRKITPSQAKRIRQLHQQGELSASQIGKIYGVGRTTIYRTLKQNP